MPNNKFSKLLERDFKITEKGKTYFITSSIVILLGIIVMVICSFFSDKTGGALNFGMDFAGGYSIKVELGNRINTDEKYQAHLERIINAVESATDDNGVPFNVKVNQTQKQGDDETASINVRYKGVTYNGEFSDEVMNETVNPAIQKAIEKELFTEADKYTGRVVLSGSIGAAVSSELIIGAISAIWLSGVLMFIYIMYRFQPLAGLAAILSQLHDVMIIIAFMAFTRIQVNSVFIAAIITIMGYAINNTIIIFDRIREIAGQPLFKKHSAKQIANLAVKQSVTRTINTTLTTLVPIVLLTIIGVPSIREFAAPIIIGLLSGVYSSNFLAPSFWAIMTDRQKVKRHKARRAAIEAKRA